MVIANSVRREASDRDAPHAATRRTISGIVLEELDRSRPSGSHGRLAADSTLADSGIDASRFLDAVHRLEGRYGMRFRAEWLENIVTCGDLIERVAERMFDAGDVSAAVRARSTG